MRVLPLRHGLSRRFKPQQLRKFLATKRMEVSIPLTFRRKGLRLDGYERIGGMTNRNYKLYLGDETLVLRLPGRGVGRLIKRQYEKKNHQAAAQAGFTPPVLYFGPGGKKLSEFIDEAETLSPERMRQPEQYLAVATFLRRFHASSVAFVNSFDVLKLLRFYEHVARQRFCRFYAGYRQERLRLKSLEPMVRSFCYQSVACHNDLVPENFLRIGDELQLIDWEYSGRNDPAWDIASLFLESELPEADCRAFLDAYLDGSQEPDQFVLRLRCAQILQDVLWSVWALLEEASSRDKARGRDIRRYGQVRFDRAVQQLDDLIEDLGGAMCAP